jgi:putative transposase
MTAHKLWHRRGYLPHFDHGAVVQFITFRLGDSLPRRIYESLKARAKNDAALYHQLETMIDEGRGACLLANSVHANRVRRALRHFDGLRYRLISWVIMPNHVHAVVEQMQEYRMGDVIHSRKSFTAKAINREIGSRGSLWAPDYFDRFIRDGAHLGNVVAYVESNPVKAGLVDHAEDWAFSSAAERAGAQNAP